MEQFFIGTQRPALYADAFATSHALEADVNSTASTDVEIDELFDDITYDKGASLVKMVRSVLTRSVAEPSARDFEMTEADGLRAESTDPMLQVVREYIQKFKYGIASTEDFWDSVDAVVREDALDEETSETVRGLRTFTRSRGYPLLTLSIEDGGDAELLVLSQRPFGNGTLLADARAALDCDASADEMALEYAERCWYLEIPYRLGGAGGDAWTVLSHRNTLAEDLQYIEMEKVTGDGADGGWVLLNVNRQGFYRVQYDPEMYARLAKAVVREAGGDAFSETDVAGLVDDRFALSIAGADTGGEEPAIIETLRMMDAVKSRSLAAEIEYSPWIVIADVINWVVFRMRGEGSCLSEELKEKFVDYFLDDILEKDVPMMAADDDSETVTLLRSPLYLTEILHGGTLELNFKGCVLANFVAKVRGRMGRPRPGRGARAAR